MTKIEELEAEVKFKDEVIRQLKDLVESLEEKIKKYQYYVSP